MATDHRFFDKFFDDAPRHECCKCGAETGLVPFGSATGGAQLWICQNCKRVKGKEDREHRAAIQAKLKRSEEFDRFEEPRRR